MIFCVKEHWTAQTWQITVATEGGDDANLIWSETPGGQLHTNCCVMRIENVGEGRDKKMA
jgi:hypothetical protein